MSNKLRMFKHPLCQTGADLLCIPVMLWDPSNMPEIRELPNRREKSINSDASGTLNQIWGQVKDLQGFSVRVTPEERKERKGQK